MTKTQFNDIMSKLNKIMALSEPNNLKMYTHLYVDKIVRKY